MYKKNILLKFFNIKPKYYILFACAIYFLACIFSDGYLHPDEHFQIIEFANYKLGLITSNNLAWEFSKEIRSSFQPWFAYFFLKLAFHLNLNNNYLIAFLLRLLTASLSIIAIKTLIKTNISKVSYKFKKAYIFISYFLWFLPLINIRFSSESWSGIFFIFAIVYSNQKKYSKNKYYFFSGLMFGIAFICRFQVGIMILSTLIYYILHLKIELKKIKLLLLGIFLIMFFSIIGDSIFYKHFEITSWNYFKVNILQNVASNFGTMGIIDYLIKICNGSFLPIGILIFGSSFLYLISNLKSLYSIIIIPFLIIHLIIPHKEIRFLFPIINLLPFVIIKGIEELVILFQKPYSFNLKFIGYFLLLLNAIILFIFTFYAPENGRIRITRTIKTSAHHKTIGIISNTRNNPFEPYSFLQQSFYLPNSYIWIRNENYDTLFLKRFRDNIDTNYYFIVRSYELLNNDLKNNLEKIGLKQKFSGNYPLVLYFLKFANKNFQNNNYLVFTYK